MPTLKPLPENVCVVGFTDEEGRIAASVFLDDQEAYRFSSTMPVARLPELWAEVEEWRRRFGGHRIARMAQEGNP